ncbi:ABC-F family ATP-binding cassette domain-containing protein [Candidatus Peribacteria bacterium]|nr:ABC-F family ATP-binding cassette domain-containing protein [Candidatus Peribacteria bacterium]
MFTTHSLSIGYSYPLCEGISLSLDSAARLRVALIGPNGSGKTTLIQTLLGRQSPLAGSVTQHGERLGYLPQHPELPPDTLVGEYLEAHLEESWHAYLIDIALETVGLGQELLLQSTSSLSGGQQMRIKLAEILLQEPTILLLDEPSNHLDDAGKQWLEGFIEGFNGSVVLISHDRNLLQQVVTSVWELHPHTRQLELTTGSYAHWRAERARKRADKEARYAQLERQIREIDRWLRAHEFHPKYQFSDRVMSQKKKLADLEALALPLTPVPDPVLRLPTTPPRTEKRRLLLRYDVAEKRYGQRVVLSAVSGKVYSGQRVEISGPNGSGKSTLLQILRGEDTAYSGHVWTADGVTLALLSQHCSLPPHQRVEEVLGQRLPLSDTEYHRLLQQMQLLEYRQSRIGDLSGGQQKRVEMALLLASPPDILLLDEPTNHLDLFAQESLECFLQQYPGAIIFITHDALLREALAAEQQVVLGKD